MYVTDPDTPNPETDAPDPAAAAAEAPAPEVPAEPVDEAEGMLAALKDAGEMPEPEPELPPGAEPPADDPAKAPEAAKPDPAKPEPEPNKEIEDEIAAMEKANGKPMAEGSKTRFRDLVNENNKFHEALKAAGIKDVAEITMLAKHAKDGADMIEIVSGTGASPDQFGMTLDYLTAIVAAGKGDRAAAERAWEMATGELKVLAEALGKEMPGVYDPLAAHEDLRNAIEAGDITRKAALEVAQARTLQGAQAQAQQRTAQQHQAQAAQQQAEAQGVEALKAWEAPKLADPAYAAIRPALNAEVAKIRQQYPPAQWAAMTDYAYRALAAQAKPAAPAKPTPGPVRPGGPRPAMMPTTDDPLEAMMQGIAAATP